MKEKFKELGEDLGGIWDSTLGKTTGISIEVLRIGFGMEDEELSRISKTSRVLKFLPDVFILSLSACP